MFFAQANKREDTAGQSRIMEGTLNRDSFFRFTRAITIN